MDTKTSQEFSSELQTKIQYTLCDYKKRMKESNIPYNDFCRVLEESTICVLTRLLECVKPEYRDSTCEQITAYAKNAVKKIYRSEGTQHIGLERVPIKKTNPNEGNKNGH